MNHAQASLPQDPEALHWLRNWIQVHTGIVFLDQKLPILEQRLTSLMVHYGHKSIKELVLLLQLQPSEELITRVIDLATTNHTHFFREFDAIDYLNHQIIASFDKEKSVRLWSAAASSGEELYTIAMTLVNTFGLTNVKSRFSLLGTDVNPKVIEHAERGIYCASRLEDIPIEYKDKWFTPTGLDSFGIKDDLKSLCLFRRLNLLSKPWPFGKSFHIIFLRNILYYFDTKTQENLICRLYEATEPGGWLITSVTENITVLQTPWHRVHAGIYRKL